MPLDRLGAGPLLSGIQKGLLCSHLGLGPVYLEAGAWCRSSSGTTGPFLRLSGWKTERFHTTKGGEAYP